MERFCDPVPLCPGTVPHPRNRLVRPAAGPVCDGTVGVRLGANGSGCGRGSAAVFPAGRNRAGRARGDPARRCDTSRLCLDDRRCHHRDDGADRLYRARRPALERTRPANLRGSVADDGLRDRPGTCRACRRTVYRFAALRPQVYRKTRGASEPPGSMRSIVLRRASAFPRRCILPDGSQVRSGHGSPFA